MSRLCLFAHFDAQGEVKRFILQYLQALRQVCDRIVFVSTAKLSPAELAKVAPYCSDAFTRDNVGFDFGMWKDALSRVDATSYDELVLTNSSVFGPLSPLPPIFEAMSKRTDVDVWGMTDNIEIEWHLQSYFIVFRKKVLASADFRMFWESILPYRDKDQVIRAYEVGLSRWLLDRGYKLAPYVALDSLPMPKLPPSPSLLPNFYLWWRVLARRANPTCAYPVALLRAGFPFVKAELLRDNPLHAPLEPVIEAVKQTGFDMSLIEFDRPTKSRGVPPLELSPFKRNGKKSPASFKRPST